MAKGEDALRIHRAEDVKRLHPWIVLIFLAGLMVLFAGVVRADKYKAGDEVEVFFLNKWWAGKVLKVSQRGEILVEYEIGRGSQQRVFTRNLVRPAFESKALSPGRTWTDDSGQFRIQAALLAIDGDQVTLRKPDMTEVQVPISKLSATDQAFLKRLMKEAGPAATMPAIESFEHLPGTDSRHGFSRSLLAPFSEIPGHRAALTADPIPSYLKMKEGGAIVPLEHVIERIGTLLPVGGPDAWLLVSVESQGFGQARPTQLFWASLARKKIEGRQRLLPGEQVLDYHPPSRRLLTYANLRAERSLKSTAVLTLWEVAPAEKEAKAIVRWNVDADGHGVWTPWAPWGRLIDGETVIQRWRKDEIVGWDAANKRMAYRIPQHRAYRQEPTISGGRKYLFLSDSDAVRIYETKSGELVSTLPLRWEEREAAVAVSEDGRRAAVWSSNALTVWDLLDADVAPQRVLAGTMGLSAPMTLSWVGGDRLMADRGFSEQLLFSLRLEAPLWRYQSDSSVASERLGNRLREIVDEHLVYVARASSNLQGGLVVGAVRLPGPKVDEAAASLTRNKLMIIRPGTRVRLEVRAGGDSDRVRATIEQKIAANGWVLVPEAATVVVAEMKQGETEQHTYRPFTGNFPPTTVTGQEQTVSVTPRISTVRVEVNSAVAWRSTTSTGAPSSIRLQEGQTIQGEIDRLQKPNPEFFEEMEIPDHILDPALRDGLGTTLVSNRGLVPQ